MWNSQVERRSSDVGKLASWNRLRVGLSYLVSVDADDVTVDFLVSRALKSSRREKVNNIFPPHMHAESCTLVNSANSVESSKKKSREEKRKSPVLHLLIDFSRSTYMPGEVEVGMVGEVDGRRLARCRLVLHGNRVIVKEFAFD